VGEHHCHRALSYIPVELPNKPCEGDRQGNAIDTAGLAQTDGTAHKSHGKIEPSRARGQLLSGQSFRPLIPPMVCRVVFMITCSTAEYPRGSPRSPIPSARR
jgi:hypothetical protein